MIQIEYHVENAGWAIGRIGNGEKTIEFDISYLNDSLKELAESAIDIKTKNTKSVIFMSEPGEHKLVLQKNIENKIEYELRWYLDWASWDLISESDYKTVLKGETTIPNYINEVRNVLIKIMEKLSPEIYKEKWKEHEFPSLEFNKIK